MNDIFIPKTDTDKQKAIAAGLREFCAGKTAAVLTFGCQQNESDSEKINGLLALCGYTPASDASTASLVIINTCAIREHAEQKALSVTGRFKKLKEENKDALIGICGCMVQGEKRREQIKNSYPYVDFVFGTDMIHALPEIIEQAMFSGKRVFRVNEKPHDEFGVISEGVPSVRESSYKAWLSIMYGCNNFCSYCIVPKVRGRERSRAREDILAETAALTAEGYKDITLLGQNVNSYSANGGFPALLADVCAVPGDFWVRFMTSHPKDASGELIRVIAENEKAAKHFHLPFQSGSDKILERMNRRYTKAAYLEKALEIKEKIPGVAITTDVICGFPGESDEDFADTLDVVSRVGFDMIYTFLYSPRPGTPAADMEGQIPHGEKVKRFDLLTALQNEKALERNREFIGKTIRVLSDGCEKGIYSGRNSQNKIVVFDSPVEKGVFCEVTVTEAQAYALKSK